MTDVDEAVVVCIHSTRRARRSSPPGTAESKCAGCKATILVSSPTRAYGQAVALHLLCPACAIFAGAPDDRPPDHVIPGTVDALENAGIPNAQRYLDGLMAKSVRELARQVLRNTVGGQG